MQEPTSAVDRSPAKLALLAADSRPALKRWTSSPSPQILREETKQVPGLRLMPAPSPDVPHPVDKNILLADRLSDGSESGYKSDDRAPAGLSTVAGKGNNRRLASHALGMTVETETVNNRSAVHSTLSNAASAKGAASADEAAGNMAVKAKKSVDTIKPNKRTQKQKKARQSVIPPTSSKADIFAARVASALDSADNSSDSDETFIYESNPPEGRRMRHSRSPSNSSSTPYDYTQPYAKNQSLNGRRSMKFASEDRLHPKPSQASLRIHPSAHAHGGYTSKHSSRPSSPRYLPGTKATGPRLMSNPLPPGSTSSRWSIYDGDRDDDEEGLPMLTKMRRRKRAMRSAAENKIRMSWCIVVTITLLVFTLLCGLSLIYSLNYELQRVHATDITHVLVSEEEIFFDMVVSAVNPNIVGISVASGDLSLIAKSEWAGSLGYAGNIVREEENLLLGHVREFNTPFSFPGFPLGRSAWRAIGGIRLDKPGNATQDDGIDRWVRVSDHPFELIVRGTLQYNIPLTGRTRRTEIEKRVIVDPKEHGRRMNHEHRTGG